MNNLPERRILPELGRYKKLTIKVGCNEQKQNVHERINKKNNYKSNKKNHVIAQFVCPEKLATNEGLMALVYNQFEKASYRINSSPGSTGFNEVNPLDKNISYFADLRLSGNQFTYNFLK